jgi:hypothetical protein
MNQYQNSKPPVAAVVRPDVYSRLKEKYGIPLYLDRKISIYGLPVLPDSEAPSIALAQTEECMLFYDQKSLSLYLNRAENPMAWVKHCCELAGIPYPTEDDPRKQFPPTM